jgi:glycerol-3-phosphate acyltransferase PlsY
MYVLQFNKDINLLIFFISCIILIKHRSNILRLFNKTESKINF